MTAQAAATRRFWIWERPEWPRFRFDADALEEAERRFLTGAGVTIGATRHLCDDQRNELSVALLSAEAVETSAIEGEHLDRISVQSSVRRRLGLQADPRKGGAAEAGVAELMVALYAEPGAAFDAERLFAWHRLVMAGRRDLAPIGAWRAHAEPMQIVSGPDYDHRIHYQAPPSARVAAEMAQFLEWSAASAPTGAAPLRPVARAGLAHLWFELIHPFEDGNGRIGRAISERLLSEAFDEPVFTGLAVAIAARRRAYYEALEQAGRGLDATEWLLWFAEAALGAQAETLRMIEHLIAKARLFDRLGDQLHDRQGKALLRLFDAGPDGFIGGMSAANYRSITGASPATAGRDLADLVAKGALMRTGENKGARYWLAR